MLRYLLTKRLLLHICLFSVRCRDMQGILISILISLSWMDFHCAMSHAIRFVHPFRANFVLVSPFVGVPRSGTAPSIFQRRHYSIGFYPRSKGSHVYTESSSHFLKTITLVSHYFLSHHTSRTNIAAVFSQTSSNQYSYKLQLLFRLKTYSFLST